MPGETIHGAVVIDETSPSAAPATDPVGANPPDPVDSPPAAREVEEPAELPPTEEVAPTTTPEPSAMDEWTQLFNEEQDARAGQQAQQQQAPPQANEQDVQAAQWARQMVQLARQNPLAAMEQLGLDRDSLVSALLDDESGAGAQQQQSRAAQQREDRLLAMLQKQGEELAELRQSITRGRVETETSRHEDGVRDFLRNSQGGDYDVLAVNPDRSHTDVLTTFRRMRAKDPAATYAQAAGLVSRVYREALVKDLRSIGAMERYRGVVNLQALDRLLSGASPSPQRRRTQGVPATALDTSSEEDMTSLTDREQYEMAVRIAQAAAKSQG